MLTSKATRKRCESSAVPDVEIVWRNCRFAKERGVHVEVTTLVIPTVNDDETSLRSIAKRIVEELGQDTPWHVTAYYPAYLFDAPPTPVRTLEKAYRIGREEGLKFVYLGNVPGHPYENTYCPQMRDAFDSPLRRSDGQVADGWRQLPQVWRKVANHRR